VLFKKFSRPLPHTLPSESEHLLAPFSFLKI